MKNIFMDNISDKQLISQLAKKIVRHGLSIPAIFFIEMFKYLAFFGRQLMVFFGPIISCTELRCSDQIYIEGRTHGFLPNLAFFSPKATIDLTRFFKKPTPPGVVCTVLGLPNVHGLL